MLVLTRKTGESITLGKDIVVKVLEISGQKVQLGIEAPRDLAIGRPDRPESKDGEKDAPEGAPKGRK